MKIYTKGCFQISGTTYSNLSEDTAVFTVPITDNKEVSIKLLPEDKAIEAIHQTEVSDLMWGHLKKKDLNWENLTPSLSKELSEIKYCLTNAIKKVLSICKYWLNWYDIDEKLFSVKYYAWSTDKEQWHNLPTKISVEFSSSSISHLDEKIVNEIQQNLSNRIEPFIALRHLQKAEVEKNPRYKWIDATIAAELAIKEFLIKWNPEIEILLLELPSPPLNKLYGRILENYINERSPKLKEITRGVEMRNKLVHKPDTESISTKEANDYVKAIKDAILHLSLKLWPNNKLLK